MRFAESGHGPVMRVEPGNPNRFVLRVKGAEAEIFVNTRARTIFVSRLYRRA